MAQNNPAPTQAAIRAAVNAAGPFLDWSKDINRLPGPANTPRCFHFANAAERTFWIQLTNKSNNVTGQGVGLVVPDGDAPPSVVNGFLAALNQGMAPNGIGPVVVDREVVGNNSAGLVNLLGATVDPSDYYHCDQAANFMITSSNKRGTFWLVASQESFNPDTAVSMRGFNASLADPTISWAQFNAIVQQKWNHHATQPYIWHNTAVLVWKSKTYIYNPSFPSANNSYWLDGGTTRRTDVTGRPRVSHYWLLGGVASLLDKLSAGNRVNTAVASGNIFIGGGGNNYPIDECRAMSLTWIARIGAIVNQVNILEAKTNRTQQDNTELASLLRGFGELTRPNATANANATPSEGRWTALRRG